MKKNQTVLSICTMILFVLFFNTSNAAEFKVGYIEAGSYFTYTETLKVIKSELKEMEWADKIEFPKDAYFSPGWDPHSKKVVLPQKAKELMARTDLDLIIAAGTSGNREIIKANNNKTPILGMCVSDAIKAGFVDNENDSGKDNYTVRIVPGRYKRMFQLFHDIVSYTKLGIMYQDDESRNSAANADDALEVSKVSGFKVLEQKINNMNETEDCLNGLKSLVKNGMDAFFIPSLACFDWKVSDAGKLFNYLNENKIPTFARQGTKDVKAGSLMGFSTIDFTPRGQYHTRKLIKILQGAKPRDMPMIDDVSPIISFNLATASLISFDPPIDILASSDEIFQEITLPEDRKFK